MSNNDNSSPPSLLPVNRAVVHSDSLTLADIAAGNFDIPPYQNAAEGARDEVAAIPAAVSNDSNEAADAPAVDDDDAPADAADDSDDSGDDPLNQPYIEGQALGYVPLIGSELARACGISNATIRKKNWKDHEYNNSLMYQLLNRAAYSICFNNSTKETFRGYEFPRGLEHAFLTNNVLLEERINIGCLVCPDAIQRATGMGYTPEGRYAVVERVAVVVQQQHSSSHNLVLICDTWTGCFYDSHSKACASSETTELCDIMTLSNLEQLVQAGKIGLPEGWRHKISYAQRRTGGTTHNLISPLGVQYEGIKNALNAAKVTQLATMREVLAHLNVMKGGWKQLVMEWHQACPDDETRKSKRNFVKKALSEDESLVMGFDKSQSLLKFIGITLSHDDDNDKNDPNFTAMVYSLNNNVGVGDDLDGNVCNHLVATTVEVQQPKRKRGDDNARKGTKIVYRLKDGDEYQVLPQNTMVAVKIESLTDADDDSIPTDGRNEFVLLNFDGVFHEQKEGDYVQLSTTRAKKVGKKGKGGTKEEKVCYYLTAGNGTFKDKVDESLFVFASAGEPLTPYKETDKFAELNARYEQCKLAGVLDNREEL
ncbi:hypothetical protein ACHAWC_007107 [Mediolabrus comicus]